MEEMVYIDTNDVYFWSNLLILIFEKRRSDVKLNCFWSGILKKKLLFLYEKSYLYYKEVACSMMREIDQELQTLLPGNFEYLISLHEKRKSKKKNCGWITEF